MERDVDRVPSPLPHRSEPIVIREREGGLVFLLAGVAVVSSAFVVFGGAVWVIAKAF